MRWPYTDLACERRRANTKTCGVTYSQKNCGGFDCEELLVTSEEGAEQIGKPMGKYLTVNFQDPETLSDEEEQKLSCSIGTLLKSLLPEEKAPRLLVLGLGNRDLTVDAIGCETVERIHATRYLAEEDPSLFRKLRCAEIATLCPGIASTSGMEAATVAAACAREIQPTAILAIDALVSTSHLRLLRTVQMCNTGITPGSGIRNHRAAIDEESMGVPVIAIGIPTVIDAATLCEGGCIGIERGALLVTAKDCDITVKTVSKILADAINLTLGISFS